MAMDFREPMPKRPPQDYTGRATHMLRCGWCGHREAFVEPEPLGWMRAVGKARKRGWLSLPVRDGEAPRYVCSDVCAAHHPHHRGMSVFPTSSEVSPASNVPAEINATKAA